MNDEKPSTELIGPFPGAGRACACAMLRDVPRRPRSADVENTQAHALSPHWGSQSRGTFTNLRAPRFL
ncbi:hypothetical protein SKAU_G00091070 [Synaphobranchus kaupii]|uniref:Uncharacterized protein n=1 Tax=Synaphobranchus kaupii TaxID=118154 RepID=A0A9Q1J659_SYNKA|nr:hypothetical protein SKAU_G00091070 [Synaphobranchus kaupii]